MKNIKEFIRLILPPIIVIVIKTLKSYMKNAKDYSLENIRLFEKNKTLKNRHTGERCFILGGGPSIKNQDLKKLKGEYVISLSSTYLHPDFHYFRPRYHVCAPTFPSLNYKDGKSQGIEYFKTIEKTVDAEMFFHIGDKKILDENGLFKNKRVYWNEYCAWDENDPIKEIDLSAIQALWSVSEYALSLAIYMGFEKIYLLGIDHDWYNGVVIHFFDEKDNAFKPPSDVFSFADSEFQMRRHAYIFRKYKALRALHGKIYNANANPDTYVDVFPKVEYDSLFLKPDK